MEVRVSLGVGEHTRGILYSARCTTCTLGFKGLQVRFPTVGELMRTLLCVPIYSSSKRALSMLKKSATEFRSDIGQDTLCAIMALKYNVDDCCHTDVIMDKELLKRAKSESYLYNN